MKSIFDSTARDEILRRIRNLNEKNSAVWGKMSLYQMMKHCTLWDEWIQRSGGSRQLFIGKILGKLMLKKVMKDEAPLRKNSPTLPAFVTTGEYGDFTSQQEAWIASIRQYENYEAPEFIHAFFGKMTKEQIGVLVYKHADHHLRQFGG
ncbi:MAG: DUF1569 domain-containing protein [Bacteroidia bacterium]